MTGEPHDKHPIEDLTMALAEGRPFVLIIEEGPAFVITGQGDDEQVKSLLLDATEFMEKEGLGE